VAISPREIGNTGESHLGPLSTLRGVVVVPARSATGWGPASLSRASHKAIRAQATEPKVVEGEI